MKSSIKSLSLGLILMTIAMVSKANLNNIIEKPVQLSMLKPIFQKKLLPFRFGIQIETYYTINFYAEADYAGPLGSPQVDIQIIDNATSEVFTPFGITGTITAYDELFLTKLKFYQNNQIVEIFFY